MMQIKIATDQYKSKIKEYLTEVQNDFDPPLLNRIKNRSNVESIDGYIDKIFRFGSILYFDHEREIGGVAILYANDEINNNAYIPLLSVKNKFSGQGVAKLLVKHCLYLAKKEKMKIVKVKTWKSNKSAIHLYNKMGFTVVDSSKDIIFVKYL